jgi:hypothetical protein
MNNGSAVKLAAACRRWHPSAFGWRCPFGIRLLGGTVSRRFGISLNGSALAELYLPVTPTARSPFVKRIVPSSAPSLFLVTTVANHWAYSLVPIVPSIPSV